MKSDLQAIGAAGAPLDATFSVQRTRAGFEVIVDSKGGGRRGKGRPRNPEYEKLFTLLLERAEALGSCLTGAWVVSSDTAQLPAAARELLPQDLKYPVDLALVDDFNDLRIRLSRMQGSIARQAGARGPGNRNRRVLLRFRLDGSHTEASVAAALVSGRRSKKLVAASRTGSAQMLALETSKESAKARADFEKLFSTGGEELPGLRGKVYWHEDLGTWGHFGRSIRTDGTGRVWNAFGQLPINFRSHIVVEINTPLAGQDLDLQGVFARDQAGRRWLLHQGRMSISGKRITQLDFRAKSGLRPVRVRFRDGSSRLFHPVADIEQPARAVQIAVARFVAICAEVREASRSSAPIRRAIADALSWEALLKPELTGDYEVRSRSAARAERRHGQVWKKLVADLKRHGIQVSNARVGQYGPDLYTVQPPLVLFEIKSDARACDLFAGIGQLHVYEKLMGRRFAKVLVVPAGASAALKKVLPGMRIQLLEYDRAGRSIQFDSRSLLAAVKR